MNWKQVSIRVCYLSGHLLYRRKVVQDPEAPTISRDNEVVEVLLNRDPVNRRMWQIVLQSFPVRAVVVRDINAIFRPDVKQTLPHRVLAHAMRITQHRMRNAIGDQFPGLTVISRFVNPWVAVVLLMAIDCDVSSASVVTRRFDVTDGAPCEHVSDVLSNVRPVLAAVPSNLHLAVIRSRPDRSGFFR